MLDKFHDYHVDSKLELNHERLDSKVPDYELMTSRPELPTKPGTNLDYAVQSARTMGVGDTKRPVMEMSKVERRTVFPRQVISPRRGCYR